MCAKFRASFYIFTFWPSTNTCSWSLHLFVMFLLMVGHTWNAQVMQLLRIFKSLFFCSTQTRVLSLPTRWLCYYSNHNHIHRILKDDSTMIRQNYFFHFHWTFLTEPVGNDFTSHSRLIAVARSSSNHQIEMRDVLLMWNHLFIYITWAVLTLDLM